MQYQFTSVKFIRMDKNANPLLYPFETPYETVPFRTIRTEHYEPAVRKKIAIAKKQLKNIINDQSEPSFKNTFIPIEKTYDAISRIGLILFNLNSAETSNSIQSVTQKVSPLLTRFMSSLLLKRSLYRRVEHIYSNRENERLSSEEIRLVETTLKSMKRNGAALPARKKLRLIRLQMKLSKLPLKFNKNVLDETNNYSLHITQASDLAGLPATVIESAEQTANEKNQKGWIFTLKVPSYNPFIKFADKRPLREEIYKAYTSRGNRLNKTNNRKLILKIINLRRQQAKLLGYANYAEYVLEERMAKSPSTVLQFINDLHNASFPVAKNEIEEVQRFAMTQGFKGQIMPWDFAYYSEKLKAHKYGFNEEMVKPYFQLNNVIKGVFGLGSQLYGIQFKAVHHLQVYHPDVSTYEVYDKTGSFLAVLYTDFHPREHKQGGAWMTEYLAQSNIEGQTRRPHISICCNFTKPTNTEPSLLTFTEVNTLLHEFGHALHGMLANTVYPSLSGTNVYRDFVELPSQIMENWLTETEWLEQFAIHYKTGETIPTQLVKKLVEARNFQSGYLSERQLTFGLLDMAWHTIEKPYKGNVKRFEREKISTTSHLPNIETSCISTAFSHIFSGAYAAGYYGYKWAEVLDADAFSEFQNEGIFNPQVANRFRKEILEKGGTAHPLVLYSNFKGKAPSIDALLKRSGLI